MSVINNSINVAPVNNNAVVGTGTGFTNMEINSMTSRGNNIMARDANGNVNVNVIFIGTTTTTSTGGTIPMYIGSAQTQVLTGSMTETYVLPQATTLDNGWNYIFNNNSTQNLYIQYFDTTPFTTVIPGAFVQLFLDDDSTDNGVWDYHWEMPSNASYGTAGLSVTGYLSTAPSSSATSSLTIGTGYQNTLGYDVILTVYLAVTAAASANILCGVGITSTPTQQTIISSLTLGALAIIPVTVYLPNQYYCLISTSGSITQTISGQQVTPV